jgi:hypothetical protein
MRIFLLSSTIEILLKVDWKLGFLLQIMYI